MIRNMTNLFGTSGSSVAGQAIVGDNGIDAFIRSDFDLFVISDVVNDAGMNDATNIDTVYKPTMQKIIDKTMALGKPVVIIIEMGGHYIIPNDAGSSYNYTNFNKIRDYLLSLRQYNHVTVIDWHGATVMADIAAYAARYYSGVGALNTAAGTYTGDFIHPTDEGHKVAHNLIATASGLRPPSATDPRTIRDDRLRAIDPNFGSDVVATIG
jgi:hypothetical protein